MTRFDPTVFGSIWGENFGQSQARQLQREAMDRAYGNDEFNQKMATDQFGLAKDHLALQQQQAADNYVLQQQQEQRALELMRAQVGEKMRRREINSKVLRAIMHPVVQQPGPQDLNYDPSQNPMDTVPGGVGPPVPRQIDVGGWDQRQNQALQNVQPSHLLTEEEMQWLDKDTYDKYQNFLQDQEGVRNELKGVLLDFNSARMNGNAKYLYDHFDKEMKKYGSLRDLLGPNETPDHIAAMEQMAREQERTKMLAQIGIDQSDPRWWKWMEDDDKTFEKKWTQTDQEQTKLRQQQALQEQVGGLIQKKRAGQPLTPQEEGLLATTPSVNQFEVQGQDGMKSARMEEMRRESVRKQVADLDGPIKELEAQLDGYIDPLTGDPYPADPKATPNPQAAQVKKLSDQLRSMKSARNALSQQLVGGGIDAVPAPARLTGQPMQDAQAIVADFVAKNGRNPTPEEGAQLKAQYRAMRQKQ